MSQSDSGAIRRTIGLLRTISTFRGQWFELSELAERAKLAKSTTHRYLIVFAELDIVEQSEFSPKYRAKSQRGSEANRE